MGLRARRAVVVSAPRCEKPFFAGDPVRAETFHTGPGCAQRAALELSVAAQEVTCERPDGTRIPFRDRVRTPVTLTALCCWNHLGKMPAAPLARLKRAGTVTLGCITYRLLKEESDGGAAPDPR